MCYKCLFLCYGASPMLLSNGVNDIYSDYKECYFYFCFLFSEDFIYLVNLSSLLFLLIIFSSFIKILKILVSNLTLNDIQVSQKLMVQGYLGHARYTGGLDVARKVLRSDGIRGLYRGFGLSVITYSPSSAVWWASYGSSQRFIWR